MESTSLFHRRSVAQHYGWHLQDIALAPVAAEGSLLYQFECNRWLAKSEDDGEILRELGNPSARNPEALEKMYRDIDPQVSPSTS